MVLPGVDWAWAEQPSAEASRTVASLIMPCPPSTAVNSDGTCDVPQAALRLLKSYASALKLVHGTDELQDAFGHPCLALGRLADRAVDLDDAVVEVDEHHAVGDDALAPDRHVLEGGDGALLADHALGADADLALVRADLRAMADPRPAPEVELRALADLERDV